MANSVSKINVVVGANTSQLTAGMNQAAAAVGGGMSKVQQVSQAATFAVDDFFAAFATGGVAGGLRGAGNNLTQIASMLGGIKTQLLVIAGLAVGQLIAKQFDGASKRVDALRASLDELARAAADAKRTRESASEIAGLRLGRVRIGATGEMGLSDIDAARETNASNRQAALNASRESEAVAKERRNAVLRLRGAALSSEGHAHKWSEETKKSIADAEREAELATAEVAHRKQVVEEINKEGIALQKLAQRRKEEQAARQRLIDHTDRKEFQPFVTQGMRDETNRQLEEVTDELNARRAKFSMADMFRMMPSMNTMGSSGAIGAINSAIAGPQNARDAGPALLRGIDGTLKRIEDLEKKKKGLVEVIGL